MLRKMFLTGLIIFLNEDRRLLVALEMLASVFCLIAVLQLRPYVDPNDNLLAILSQFLMVIGLFITLMMTIDDKQYNSNGMGILLFLVMIFPIMYLIIGAIRD